MQALTIKTNTTMAQNSLPSWSLVAFARQYGKMQVGSFVSEDATLEWSALFINE